MDSILEEWALFKISIDDIRVDDVHQIFDLTQSFLVTSKSNLSSQITDLMFKCCYKVIESLDGLEENTVAEAMSQCIFLLCVNAFFSNEMNEEFIQCIILLNRQNINPLFRTVKTELYKITDKLYLKSFCDEYHTIIALLMIVSDP